MKYLVILGDGMADEPLEELGGMTPLEYAETPNMDTIAREGASGMLRTIPDRCEPGSDIANLSILGYDPVLYYTGRGPLEAASMGMRLTEGDVAYRCNLVTIIDDMMIDFSAGHISSREGKELFDSLETALPRVRMKAGISYRNLLVIPEGLGAVTYAPHDIVGQSISGFLPKNGDAPLLNTCMKMSREVFSRHPVNIERKKAGEPPATQIWPWSGGKKPSLPAFSTKYCLSGGMISAVDLLNGIAEYAGMEIIKVPGATGYLDTDYEAKAKYARKALSHLDFVYLHVEAPDEAGHMGSIDEKVKAIERLDGMIGALLDGYSGVVAVLPDHPTPIRVKTHTRDPVPFAVLGLQRDSITHFSEREARNGSLGVRDARDFLTLLFSIH